MVVELTPQSLAITLLIALSVYGVVRYFTKRKISDHESVNWSPLEAIAITVAIYFVTQVIVAIGISLAGSAMGLSSEELANKLENSTLGQFVFIALVEALTLGLLFGFMKRRGTLWKSIGMVRPRLMDIGYALAGFVAYFVVYALIIASLVKHFLPIDTEQEQQLGFNTAAAGPELILIFLSLVILPPLIEEILVRGFLFTGLKNKFSLWKAAIITSIVFGAAHLQWGSDAPLLWSAAIDTFVLSMVLVYMRFKTKSLWPGIGLHFIKNGIAFLALFVFKVV